jgi:VanZ family protein
MQFIRNYPFLPAVVFFIITVILLTLPGSSFPKSPLFDLPYFDKWVHIGLFGLLCFLFSYPITFFSISHQQKKYWFWTILFLGISYGVIMEFVQKYWVSNRSFDLMDMVADAIGCFLALIVNAQLLKRKFRLRP